MNRVDVTKKTNDEHKKRIAKLRKIIASLKMDMRMIKEHERKEANLARKYEAETYAIRDEKLDERAEIEERYISEERALLESHEREEKLLLENRLEPKKVGTANNTQSVAQRRFSVYIPVIISIIALIVASVALTTPRATYVTNNYYTTGNVPTSNGTPTTTVAPLTGYNINSALVTPPTSLGDAPVVTNVESRERGSPT